jgi:hypothetical protein
MPINIGAVIRGIVIYIIFITGLAIISEWVCASKKKSHFCPGKPDAEDKKLDEYLHRIKQEIKSTYINKLMNNYPASASAPPSLMKTGPIREHFVSYNDVYDDTYDYPTSEVEPVPEEKRLVDAAIRKLNRRVPSENNLAEHTLGKMYSKISSYKPGVDDTIYKDLYKQYVPDDKNVSWNVQQIGMKMPTKEKQTIDYKYDFTQNQGYLEKPQKPVGYDVTTGRFAYINKF